MPGEAQEARRIVVVSNRLPFTVVQNDGAIEFKDSVGGVATGLKSFLHSVKTPGSSKLDYLWVGWPGCTIEEPLRQQVSARALAEFRAYPVFLSEREIEDFYQGFCNKTIWPLFHYFPQFAAYDPGYWPRYQAVNESFAEVLLQTVRPGDIVWIHDYHLMLLPHLLRKAAPYVRLGFFLHIPFPQLEIFRLLPGNWRTAILQGLLGADVIGFHTHDYVEYFLRSVQRILGFDHQMGRLSVGGRVVKVGAFPMGIDFAKFYEAAGQPEVRAEREELRRTLGGSKIILSVDRQDYSKGIIHRLQAFETLLENSPEWHGKATLIMIVVPSRIGIEDYEGMKKQIEEYVGRINGRFGRIGWAPIIYQYRALSFPSLVALYAASDVALVTPLRDGMNLVAKEYIASRRDQTGVLIISEMAGASKELLEAITINPNDRNETANALKIALEMDPAEQIRRNSVMQDRLRRYDLSRWAEDFLGELVSSEPAGGAAGRKVFNDSARRAFLSHYRRSNRRLLALDYDGTLVPYAFPPELARPSEKVIRILRRLADDPRNDLALVTGRDRASLDRWLGSLPLAFAAEHGIWIRGCDEDWTMIKQLDAEWKARIIPTLQMYADRVPGAMVEEKEYSLAWHYRNADPEQGTAVARELADYLLAFTANIDVQVLRGRKVIEIRNTGVHKGTALAHWLAKKAYDFVLAIGDDVTDEDMFAALPEGAYTFRIGSSRTLARFTLPGCAEALELLAELAEGSEG
ncbi:MAG TPA: bifunctional alpha,alpha-trehalose-phosphate synthase (UDP-forming)/trehalose-phosphatase [candidate division Zixibacteria bacterium]|nr:bifunctional alpha,alpha-trehalose-phosphate synthase (UDP-forming)/trehalose-phosphatase [candidate division Zixibacteria bacterium]